MNNENMWIALTIMVVSMVALATVAVSIISSNVTDTEQVKACIEAGKQWIDGNCLNW